MSTTRRFTVVDGATGPVVYRYLASCLEDLYAQLHALNLTPECALHAASHAWSGAVVSFEDIALVVVPGDYAVHFEELQETMSHPIVRGTA